VFGSQLIGVVIVIVGLLTQEGELHSVRPPGRTNTQASPKTDAKTDTFARLWDDPLQVRPPAEEASSEGSSPFPSPTPTSKRASCIFLWNILDAGRWPDAKERRLRIRYAIVSAILAEGYRPLHASSLHSLRSRPGRFETFRTQDEKKNSKYVCVIWTTKQSINLPIDEPELGKITDEITNEIDNQDHVIAEGPVRFLHHGTSQDLYNLSAAGTPPPKNTAFLRATVRLERLPSPPPHPELWASLQKITTDDKLVESLFRELCLRIPALNDPCKAPRVVVFTESDTIYSKAIVDELKKQLQQANAMSNVEVYTYLQALDGGPEEARAPANPSDSKSPDVATSLLQGRAVSETSFGTSQFDYLRRAALDLKARRNRQGENVVAVGVLGSDIYDKMLVLQAVRPALPSAVFFTTDLDALYLERDMQPFTRNLVVASADDLDVKESRDHVLDVARDDVNILAQKAGNLVSPQWKLPPMRDSYQTVLVKEVQHILRHRNDKPAGRAHIFEIGAGKRVDLTDAGGLSWPLWWLAQPWFNALIFIPALLNAFLILWAVTTRDLANKPAGAMKKWARCVVYGEATLAGCGLVFLLFKLTNARSDLLLGEPLSLGISIWPTVMIRLLAFLVAVVLLSLASRSFVVYGSPQEDNLKNALPENVKFRWRKWMWGLLGPSGHVSRDEFFEKLFAANGRKWRIFIASLAYLAFSFVLFAKWPPNVPARSGLPLLLEKIVLALGVALYIIHLIFCLELHVSALRLLRQLRLLYSSAPDENQINATEMLSALSTLTTIIGKTLLYPLTVLILIILSRLSIFDNWVPTASLVITFAGGAIVLVGASLILWLEGAGLKKIVLAQRGIESGEKEKLQDIGDGVFATWYSQPIFTAIFSLVAVFGSVTIARPLSQLFFNSF
jgi:hypothetical protein